MNNLLYTRKEAAEVLRISTDTLDRLAARNSITPVNIGSRVYYTPEAVQHFVARLVKEGIARA